MRTIVVIASGVEGPTAGDLGRTPPCLPQQFLREAHRAAHVHRDLAHAVALAALHPQRLALRRRERGQDLVRRNLRDVIRRVDRALRRFLIGDAALLSPVVRTRVANRRIKPRLRMLDASFARLQPTQEDVVYERLRLVDRNAVLFFGMRAQPDG
jgi:hypothetical protein